MASVFDHETTALTEVFSHKGETHSYSIRWRSLGDPKHPPLVFVHGTPWTSRVWVPFARALSRQFRVYLFDRPGFGDSPPEQKLPGTCTSSDKVIELDADLARQSGAFAALLKLWQRDWGDQKPHVVAHDNAGLVTLRAHLLHGCPYASLCLIDVVAIGPFGQSLFKSIAEDPRRFEELPDAAFEGILEGYIRQAAFYDLSKEKMQMLKAPWLREGGKAGFIRELCQASSRSIEAVEERYGEVGPVMPVKVIWGADDDWLPVEMAWRLADALKAKEVAVIEKAGHLIMFDQGAQLGVELGRWLTAVSLTQST